MKNPSEHNINCNYSILQLRGYNMNENIFSYFRKLCDINAIAFFVCGQSVFIYQTKCISLEEHLPRYNK